MKDANLPQNFNKINSEGLLINYDGKNMDVSGYKNDNSFYAKLTNKDIMDLLAISANPMSLDKRLKKDFPIKHKTRRHHKKHKKSSRSTKKRTPTPYPKK